MWPVRHATPSPAKPIIRLYVSVPSDKSTNMAWLLWAAANRLPAISDVFATVNMDWKAHLLGILKLVKQKYYKGEETYNKESLFSAWLSEVDIFILLCSVQAWSANNASLQFVYINAILIFFCSLGNHHAYFNGSKSTTITLFKAEYCGTTILICVPKYMNSVRKVIF